MRRRTLYICLLLVVCAAGAGWWGARRVHATVATPTTSAAYAPAAIPGVYLTNWSPPAAANYLDRREVWWQNWPPTQMDRGTICISCHTVVPYAMMRTTLSQNLHEVGTPAPEKVLMDSVETRVSHWSEMVPFYTDADYGPGKTAQSHSTEAVLNAVILVSYDVQHGQMRPITRTALGEAWALQEKTGVNAGGWNWQDFHLAPWESAESSYQGAALLMLEIANAPDGYAEDPAVHGHLQQLQNYLRTHYESEPLMNQLYILWLSSKVPGLMTAAQRKTLLEAVRNRQQPDGGWCLYTLDPVGPGRMLKSHQWKRAMQRFAVAAKPAKSDGYATALVAIALEKSGTGRQDAALRRGLEWLERHQRSDGSWRAYSLNINRDPKSDIAQFMNDAATAYAVMALENEPSQLAEK